MPDTGVDVDGGPALDGAIVADAALADASTVCVLGALTNDELSGDTGNGGRSVDLASRGTSFAVAWEELGAILPELHVQTLSSDGTMGAVQRLTDGIGLQESPVITRDGEGWLALWVDSLVPTIGGHYDIRSRQLDADLLPVGDVFSLSSTPQLRESAPTLWAGPTARLAAWIEDDSDAAERSILIRPVAADGQAEGEALVFADSLTTNLALKLVELSAGPALLRLEGSDLFLRALSRSGQAQGADIHLNPGGLVSGIFDADIGVSGGAVVFDARVAGIGAEVRFRAVGGDGQPVGGTQVLSGTALATGGSIARFSGGYAVAFRSQDRDNTRIVVVLVDEVGGVLSEVEIAQTSTTGGPTRLAVAGDGQLAVMWTTDSDTGTATHISLLGCLP